jgi:quinol monooxygenase YgiN
MIVVVETIQATPGKMDDLKRALLELVPVSRKAAGCLQYDLLEPADQGEELLVLMRWKSLTDLRRHEASDYIAEFVKKYDRTLYNDFKVTEWKDVPEKREGPR